MWYVISITDVGISLIGPFEDDSDASKWGNVHCDDPRWNVVWLDHYSLAEQSMFNDEPIDTPALVLRVTKP